MMRTFSIATLMVTAAALAACGGSTEPHAGAVSVVVTPAAAAVLIGQSQPYTATAVDADGQPIPDATFTWKSSATGIASISADGLAQGVAPGATQITASWNGVTSDPATLVVGASQIAAIHVDPTSATIKVGETQSFTAIAFDANGAPIPGVTFAWASSNPSAATIGDDGVATGAAAGTTSITASANGVTSDTASLTVTSDVSACDGIDSVQTWSGSLNFSYTHTASDASDEIVANEQANVSVVLQLVGRTQYGVSWHGIATGTASLDDKEIDLNGVPPDTGSLSGSGAPLASYGGEDRSVVTLGVDLTTCQYNVTFTPTINATETDPDGTTIATIAEVGAVRSGVYSTSGYRGGLTEDHAMPAHSIIWGSQHPDEAYFPLGLGAAMFASGVEQDGNAGTADVNWTFTPSK
jgi:hypothetical protein